MANLTLAELQSLDATAMLSSYRSGELSPVDVTTAAFAAIKAVNPRLNAVIYTNEADALAEAKASEQRWRRGEPRGRLDGVPTLIKDGLQLRGVPMYRGSKALRDHAAIPSENSPCVDRLREAGAVLLGKTTMCDFGMLSSGYSSMFGPTRNPWDLSRTSGGSSSGTAAAIAAGLVPLAVGTDIVGSVRVPASFCGLAGLKPSYGRVPHYPQSSPAAVSGPMARNVTDMALLMSVITAPDQRDFAALAYEQVDYERTLESPSRARASASFPKSASGQHPIRRLSIASGEPCRSSLVSAARLTRSNHRSSLVMKTSRKISTACDHSTSLNCCRRQAGRPPRSSTAGSILRAATVGSTTSASSWVCSSSARAPFR